MLVIYIVIDIYSILIHSDTFVLSHTALYQPAEPKNSDDTSKLFHWLWRGVKSRHKFSKFMFKMVRLATNTWKRPPSGTMVFILSFVLFSMAIL